MLRANYLRIFVYFKNYLDYLSSNLIYCELSYRDVELLSRSTGSRLQKGSTGVEVIVSVNISDEGCFNDVSDSFDSFWVMIDSKLRSCSTSESQLGTMSLMTSFLTEEAGELRLLASEDESLADTVAKVWSES